MWSEEMDKKIRTAAENYNPGYDDKSWQGMEGLLDTHLPQKKKRRRIIFFLLFAVLVTGITAYFITQENSSGNKTVVEHSTLEKKDQPANPGQQQGTVPTLPSGKDNSNTAINNTEANPVNPTITDNTASADSPFGGQGPDNSTTNDKASVDIKVRGGGIAGRRKPEKEQTASTAVQNIAVSNAPISSKTDKQPNEPATIEPPVSADVTKVDVTKNEPAKIEPEKQKAIDSTEMIATGKPVKPAKKDPEKKSAFFSNFFISFSAGPDLSSVGTKTGQWRGAYGAGIGYSISDKWTVRTGFYVARKIYSADSNSYKTPFNSIGTPYDRYAMKDIKANCLVYEIPVSVAYNFGKSKKHNWFVSAGVSSYIMKTERYDCTYENQWGQIQTHTYRFKNENSHLFSVIGISGGYQYNFNKRLSFMAEPYVKMPLSGIGQGEVKLNSIGALFTLGYKPFARN
jgi:hypothetical protein